LRELPPALTLAVCLSGAESFRHIRPLGECRPNRIHIKGRFSGRTGPPGSTSRRRRALAGLAALTAAVGALALVGGSASAATSAQVTGGNLTQRGLAPRQGPVTVWAQAVAKLAD